MMKGIAIAAALAAVAVAGVITASTTMRQRQEVVDLQNANDAGTVDWYARVAKAKGTTLIVKPGPDGVEFADGIKNLGEAASYYHILVAQPVEKRSFLERQQVLGRNYDRIRTWYRFRVIENVGRQELRQCADCPASDFVPAEMLPVQPDEFLIPVGGGTLLVDGVEVFTPPIFDFDLYQQYLLFVRMREPGTWGKISVGPGGVFTVNPDKTVTPVNEKEHSLKDILKEYKNSVKELKKATKNKTTGQ